jgi:hypothetical protein
VELIRLGEIPTVQEVPADRERVLQLVHRSVQIQSVQDSVSFAMAKRIASEIKAMEDEILAAKKYVKTPIRSMENAIEQLAKEIAQPLLAEKGRIGELMGAYVQQLEAAAKEEARKRHEALQRQREQHDREIYEARKAKELAEAETRQAKDEATRAIARGQAMEKALALAQAQLGADLAEEASQIGKNKIEMPTVAGGRIDHRWKFKLVDARTLVSYGLWQCVRIELDVLGCNDVVKAQLARNPDTDPIIPGVEITRETNIHMRAASRIE